MRLLIIIFLFSLSTLQFSCRAPLYYKLNKIEGTIYNKNKAVNVDFHSRRKLHITNCQDSEFIEFLNTLTLARHGRKELEHLLTTSSKVTVSISDKTGIMFKDGKYRLMGGMTGPNIGQSIDLIKNENSETSWSKTFKKDKYLLVYKENTIEIFKGSIAYAKDRSIHLNNTNVKLFDWKTNKEVKAFSMDTIDIEPLMFPDMLYKNDRELFYFAGVHEIYHTRPENIEIQENKGDREVDAIELESKAFKLRQKINKRKIKSQ